MVASMFVQPTGEKKADKSAFSLIELIITITVITTLTLAGFETFRNPWYQLEHDAAVNKVVEIIQKARNLAINSQLHIYDSSNEPKNKVVPSAYGIQITETSNKGEIKLFIDNRYQGTVGKVDLEDIVLETYHISDNIEVTTNTEVGAGSPSVVVIFFEPPFADVSMYSGFNNENSFENASYKTDKNTAMIRLKSKLLPSTESTIYFNRLSGYPELAK